MTYVPFTIAHEIFSTVSVTGQTAGRHLGEVRTVQQHEHDNVRRHSTELHYEPEKRPEDPSVPSGAREPHEGQGAAASIEVSPRHRRELLGFQHAQPQALGALQAEEAALSYFSGRLRRRCVLLL